MRILVTGGSGFMGSNYIYNLLGSQDSLIGDSRGIVANYSKETYAVHNRVLNMAKKCGKKFTSVEGDILDASLFFHTLNALDIECVVHFAAETHVDRSFKYPEEFIQTNVVGTFRILEALRHMKKPPMLIHISTDEVFGDVSEGECDENTILKPQNPYSASKAAIESLIYAWQASYGLDIRMIRPTNNYGPRQHPEKLIAKIITRCLADREYTLWKGEAIRNWLSVNDLCTAIDTVIEKGQSGESYNVSSSDNLTVNDVNTLITRLMDKEHLFRGYEGQRLKVDQRYALNSDKLKSLGWTQANTFKKAILKTIWWYEENRWFWECAWSQ